MPKTKKQKSVEAGRTAYDASVIQVAPPRPLLEAADVPVKPHQVLELLDLDNRIEELREIRNALAANLMRRTAAQGSVVRVGPHRLQVRGQRDGERRAQVLVVDGQARFVERSESDMAGAVPMAGGWLW